MKNEYWNLVTDTAKTIPLWHWLYIEKINQS